MDDDTAPGIKLITRGALKELQDTFELAQKLGRKKVTAAHKANIMKFTDGLFLEAFHTAAKDFQKYRQMRLL